MAEFGQRREALGVSQQALADYAGVRLRAVVNLEQQIVAAGQAGPGHSPAGDKIAAALDELEANPHLLPRLQGDHSRTFHTI